MSLPSGILTFSFTDVEGSSELWERQPDGMARALVWHDRLVADTVEAHGGHLIQSMGEGDSTVSVFANAADAVAAAVSLQRALLRDGANELGLAVRIGLHTGSAEQRDGTYFGTNVNLAARVRGLADGGHIFLSSAAHHALGARLPAGCVIEDLGAHSLKGFAAREEIYAVTAGDLRAPPSTECPYQGLRPSAATTAIGSSVASGQSRTPSRSCELTDGSVWLAARAAASRRSCAPASPRIGVMPSCSLRAQARPLSHPATSCSWSTSSRRWTRCAEPELRDAFIDSLLQHEGPVAVGIRADFYGNCGDYPAFAAKVSADQLLLGAMTDEELRSAVVEPANAYGLRLEPGLVECSSAKSPTGPERSRCSPTPCWRRGSVAMAAP